jgi:hypothetical protein
MTSRTRFLWLVFLATAVGLGVLYAQAPKKAAIPYPTGFRGWTHVKSMVVFSKDSKLFERFAGLHNIYVNNIGWPSLQHGRPYPDGTVFVFDLQDVRTFQGAIETKGRKLIGVMKKNAKLYPETGGWGFELFRGYEGKGSLRDMKECFSCHVSRKQADYVFSNFME